MRLRPAPLIVACALTCSTLSAYDGKAFAGVWRGKIDNFPGVTIVISDEGTELSGAVLFYLIRRDEGQPPKPTPGDPEPMFNIKLNGNFLDFQVSHRRAHPPRTIHDPPVTFHLKLTGPDQGVFIRGQEENNPFLLLRRDFGPNVKTNGRG